MTPTHIAITHLGAETCFTGSCHLIRFQPDQGGGSVAILVDCGIAQGHDPQAPFDRFPVPPAEIDFLFLTHAHIDHIGRVPDLTDAGFCGEIICTHGTRACSCPCSGMPCPFPTGPAVIIAGSGMCTGGHNVNYRKNDPFFVGFQAQGTPGRDIVECRTPQ